MTNDEIRLNDETQNGVAPSSLVIRSFDLRHSFDIRHSCFAIPVA